MIQLWIFVKKKKEEKEEVCMLDQQNMTKLKLLLVL